MACAHCGSRKWDGAQYDHESQKILQCSECHEWDDKENRLRPKAMS